MPRQPEPWEGRGGAARIRAGSRPCGTGRPRARRALTGLGGGVLGAALEGEAEEQLVAAAARAHKDNADGAGALAHAAAPQRAPGGQRRGSAGRRPGPRDFRFRASAAAAGSPGPRPSGGAELRARRSRAGRAQRPGRRFSAVPSVRPSAVPAALPTRPRGAPRLLLAPGALRSSQHLAVQPCLKCSPAPHTSAPGSQYDPAGHVGASCPQHCAVAHL